MKRLIDSLLSRWYVPRALLEASVQNTERALWLVDEWSKVAHAPLDDCGGTRVVVTTDFQRGCPVADEH